MTTTQPHTDPTDTASVQWLARAARWLADPHDRTLPPRPPALDAGAWAQTCERPPGARIDLDPPLPTLLADTHHARRSTT